MRTTIGATVIVGLALVIASAGLVVVLRSSLRHNVATAAELCAEDVVSLTQGSGDPVSSPSNHEDDSLLDRSGRVVAASTNIDGESAIATMRPGESKTVAKVPLSEDDAYLAVARAADDGRYLVIVARTTRARRASKTWVVAAARAVAVESDSAKGSSSPPGDRHAG